MIKADYRMGFLVVKAWGKPGYEWTPGKRSDTVGQPPSTEMGVLNMPSLKAKKLSKLPR
jgi:hypothetical protein